MNATRITSLLFTSISLASSIAFAADMGTGFTYQGKLESPSGTAVDDTCDFRVGLWDAATLGNQVGASPQTKLAVAVENGIFTLGPSTTTALDFGADAIDGQARWLEIEVQCTGDANFVMLTPRVELTPAPHALALPGLHTIQNANSPNIIGGYSGNYVASGLYGATIGGGGQADIPGETRKHSVMSLGNMATIGGGLGNTVTGQFGTIAGGLHNSADQMAAVGGGNTNNAGGSYSAICGGEYNVTQGFGSVVGGGSGNKASGPLSTIPGGSNNVAGAARSFAAGNRAIVRDAAMVGNFEGDVGTFVWADSQDADFVSTGPDQFLIRASGGMGINTNNPTADLHIAGSTIIEGGAIIEGYTVIDDNVFFVDLGAFGKTVNIGSGGIPITALNINRQDAITINGFQPFITLRDSNAAFARTRIVNANGSFNFFPEGFIGGSAPMVLTNVTGRLGIGDIDPEVALDVVGDINYTGVIVDVSDERLKSDIQPLECALEKIARLRGISFTMKESSDQREVGLIAQDVQQVLPEAVRIVDDENGYLGVSYPSVVSLLVEAVKEVQTEKECEIQTLNEKLGALGSQLSELKATLAELHHKKGEN